MSDDPDLEKAYRLAGVDDNRRLYAEWADSYDEDFAANMHYLLHEHVAQAFENAKGIGAVLDVGAGTGLCGAALAKRGIGPVDATDLSPEMLQVAAGKGVYRQCFEGNLLERLPCEDNSYAGAVSSGTFTHGHVGPDALDEVLRVVRPGGLIVLSINARHWSDKGFSKTFDASADQIANLALPRVAIYGPGAEGDHAGDQAVIATFRKR